MSLAVSVHTAHITTVWNLTITDYRIDVMAMIYERNHLSINEKPECVRLEIV